MGRFVRHIACEKCGSSDGNAVYDNESTFCWVCRAVTGNYKPAYDAMSERDWRGTLEQIAQLPSANMLARGIDQATANYYGIRVEYDPATREEMAYYFPLYKDGTLVGYQKKAAKGLGQRGKKDVSRVGSTAGSLPFGAHKAGDKGAFIIVVEGCEDAAAARQMLVAQGKNYRVVASCGSMAWKQNLEYYEGFEKVMIAFDQNDEGKAGAVEFAEALSPGKAYIMRWDAAAGDDPNALLVGAASGAWWQAINNAKQYEAAGIVSGEAVWEAMQNYREPEGMLYPPEFACLGNKMGKMRFGEISTWIAGSSIGKTSFIRRIKQHTLTASQYIIGEAELEERKEKTFRGLMQFHAGGRWHELTDSQRRQVFEETYGTNRIFTVDNGLSAKVRKGGLLGKFKHLHHAKGARLFFLDHITLGVREFGDKGGSLADQDSMMEELLGFAESTNSHVCLISHLRKPPSGGESWSEGAVPTEEDMKGSGSLFQISADIIAVSRNKQHSDDYERNVSTLTVTKCRETGNTGPADRLWWNHGASRLEVAVDAPPDNHEEDPSL